MSHPSFRIGPPWPDGGVDQPTERRFLTPERNPEFPRPQPSPERLPKEFGVHTGFKLKTPPPNHRRGLFPASATEMHQSSYSKLLGIRLDELDPEEARFVMEAEKVALDLLEYNSITHPSRDVIFQIRAKDPSQRDRVRLLRVSNVETHRNGQLASVSTHEKDVSDFVLIPTRKVCLVDRDNSVIEARTVPGFENPVVQGTSTATTVQPREECPFSIRQLEILQLLSEGRNSESIAEALYISVDTVRTHRQHILQRSPVPNMTATVVLCVRKGWI